MSFELIIIVVLCLVIIGIYNHYKERIENEVKKHDYTKQNYEKQISKIEEEKTILENHLSRKTSLYNDINYITDTSVKKLTSLFADYLLLQYDVSANYLEKKSRPAYTEAKRIKELKIETKQYLEQYKLMLYKYEYLLNIFPELQNYVDDFDSIRDTEKYFSLENLSNKFDYARKYLSKLEFMELPENERNQIALDNYIKGKKTNWQIGRDYELFCGQYYENNGYNVEYFGMEKKLSDLGRDLIAKKESEIHIIQCKYWSKEKLIHEKHILQLFATTYIMEITNTDMFNHYKPVFITNINLSKTATDFAKKLNVLVIKLQLTEFPRIKCNINGDNKIYHLPFDQKYDQTQIKNNGEFYALTVEEAVSKGFRRALKYYN